MRLIVLKSERSEVCFLFDFSLTVENKIQGKQIARSKQTWCLCGIKFDEFGGTIVESHSTELSGFPKRNLKSQKLLMSHRIYLSCFWSIQIIIYFNSFLYQKFVLRAIFKFIAKRVN